MTQAALTPDGFSYDKKDLITHLQKGGNFDPLSRSYLMINQLLPNKNIEKASDFFLEKLYFLFFMFFLENDF